MVYGCEDFFQKPPIHWMWWPLLGGLAARKDLLTARAHRQAEERDHAVLLRLP